MTRRGRPTSKQERAEAHNWRVLVNLGTRSTVKGRAARRKLFETALRPGPRARDATLFVLSCVRKILKGEPPNAVMSCAEAGRPKDDAQARRRGAEVLRCIERGTSQPQAIKMVAAKYCTAETNIRRDLRHHRGRLKIEGCLAMIDATWNDPPKFRVTAQLRQIRKTPAKL